MRATDDKYTRSAQAQPARPSALDPELRLPGSVVSPLDVPVLPERIVVHRRDEVEGRLEFDVIETGLGRDQLMPLASRNEHETARTNRQAARVVFHFPGSLLDEVEML